MEVQEIYDVLRETTRRNLASPVNHQEFSCKKNSPVFQKTGKQLLKLATALIGSSACQWNPCCSRL